MRIRFERYHIICDCNYGVKRGRDSEKRGKKVEGCRFAQGETNRIRYFRNVERRMQPTLD